MAVSVKGDLAATVILLCVCSCLLWLGAGKFGEMLTRIFTGNEISSKEEPEDGHGPEKELSA